MQNSAILPQGLPRVLGKWERALSWRDLTTLMDGGVTLDVLKPLPIKGS